MKKIIPIIIVLVIVVAGAFYGGMKYGQSKSSFNNFSLPTGRQARLPDGQVSNFQGLSEEQRQQLFQGNVGEGFRQGIGSRGVGSVFLSGEVMTKDEQSLTLKMLDGSSKIIFFSGSTEISKMTDGSIDDLEIGKSVTINGKANEDGSITAQSIQLRPEINPLP